MALIASVLSSGMYSSLTRHFSCGFDSLPSCGKMSETAELVKSTSHPTLAFWHAAKQYLSLLHLTFECQFSNKPVDSEIVTDGKAATLTILISINVISDLE